MRVLEALEVLTPGEVAGLRRHGNPEVRNTRGERVGEIRPAFDLRSPAGRI